MEEPPVFSEDNILYDTNDGNEEEPLDVFANYSENLAQSTKQRQIKELHLFRSFLLEKGKKVKELYKHASAWEQVQFDDIVDFMYYLTHKRFAPSSINMYLQTIKTYCRLATTANTFSPDEYERVSKLRANSSANGTTQLPREEESPLTKEKVDQLLQQPNTPQGRRDRLLLLLLLKYGLRPKDLTTLNRNSIDFSKRTLTFYNHFLDEEQTYQLDLETLQAAKLYLADEPTSDPIDPLFPGHRKDKTIAIRLTDRAINRIIGTLGTAIGISHLSPQTCQTYWKEQGDKEKTRLVTTDSDQIIQKHPKKGRKQRPDVFNRQKFEQALRKQRVPESLIAPLVSDFRLLMPLLISKIGADEFFRIIEDSREELHLSPQTELWKLATKSITQWASDEIEKYKENRQ